MNLETGLAISEEPIEEKKRRKLRVVGNKERTRVYQTTEGKNRRSCREFRRIEVDKKVTLITYLFLGTEKPKTEKPKSAGKR